MDTYIKLEGKVTDSDSYNLKQLAQLIEQECDLAVKLDKQEIKSGTKDGGLVIGISIVSSSLAIIQTVIMTLQYWESKRNKNKYNLSVIFNKQVDGILSLDEFVTKMSQFQKENQIEDITIKITKNLE